MNMEAANEMASIVTLLQGGGNAALIVCVYFIWKVEKRLTALESSLMLFIKLIQEKL